MATEAVGAEHEEEGMRVVRVNANAEYFGEIVRWAEILCAGV